MWIRIKIMIATGTFSIRSSCLLDRTIEVGAGGLRENVASKPPITNLGGRGGEQSGGVGKRQLVVNIQALVSVPVLVFTYRSTLG